MLIAKHQSWIDFLENVLLKMLNFAIIRSQPDSILIRKTWNAELAMNYVRLVITQPLYVLLAGLNSNPRISSMSSMRPVSLHVVLEHGIMELLMSALIVTQFASYVADTMLTNA